MQFIDFSNISLILTLDFTGGAGNGFLCLPGTGLGTCSRLIGIIQVVLQYREGFLGLLARRDDFGGLRYDVHQLTNFRIGAQGVLVQRGTFHIEDEIRRGKLIAIVLVPRGLANENQLAPNLARDGGHLRGDTEGNSVRGFIVRREIRESVAIGLRASDLNVYIAGKIDVTIGAVQFENKLPAPHVVLTRPHIEHFCSRQDIKRIRSCKH